MHQYGYSWDRAHSRNHTMGNNIAAGNPGIALPLLVCKRMRDEAADVLYGTTHFKFHDTDVLERFMGAVSPLHGSKLRFVDVSLPELCSSSSDRLRVVVIRSSSSHDCC